MATLQVRTAILCLGFLQRSKEGCQTAVNSGGQIMISGTNQSCGPSHGCYFIDTACYCKQSVATQLVSCAQGNCNQTDLQFFIGWAQEACAGVGVSFDASVPSTTAQDQAIKSSIISSQASIDES